jgi:ATP-dependent Clp protease ATP-binding subunit ClpB
MQRVRERGIEVELSDRARELLGNLGYDPTYGAAAEARDRQAPGRPAALAILEGDFREGDTVRVDAGDGELVLSVAEKVAPAAA